MNSRRKIYRTALIVIVALLLAYISYKIVKRDRETNILQSELTKEYIPPFTKNGDLTFIKDNKTTIQIDIEIADTEAKRAQGLMWRKSMQENQGMLFIFDIEQQLSFWMKNTYISLDIIYVDTSMKIISIHPNTPTLSEEGILSNGDARYVIEVVAGFCNKNGIKEGDIVSFKRTNR